MRVFRTYEYAVKGIEQYDRLLEIAKSLGVLYKARYSKHPDDIGRVWTREPIKNLSSEIKLIYRDDNE